MKAKKIFAKARRAVPALALASALAVSQGAAAAELGGGNDDAFGGEPAIIEEDTLIEPGREEPATEEAAEEEAVDEDIPEVDGLEEAEDPSPETQEEPEDDEAPESSEEADSLADDGSVRTAAQFADAVAAGGTITLGADLTAETEYVASKPLVISLGGHSFTMTYGFFNRLETSADLTIKGPGTFACPIYVTGGTTTIEGGEKGGALAVKGGTVKGFYGADGWYEDGCISAKDGASVTVTGGTIGGSEKTNAGVYLEYGSSLKMSGGEISGNYYGVSGISDYGENGKKPDSGISTVERSGGKITSNDTGIRYKGWGATASSGGEIKGNNYGVTGGDVVITAGYICDNAEEGASGDDVTMSGGEVTGNRIGFTAYDSQKLKVSGGKITATDSSGSYAISFDDGCLELSGDPVIGSQDGEDGIYLGNDCKVTVAGKFEQGARIALSPGGVLGGDFTRGYSTYNGSGLPSTYFYVQGGGHGKRQLGRRLGGRN